MRQVSIVVTLTILLLASIRPARPADRHHPIQQFTTKQLPGTGTSLQR